MNTTKTLLMNTNHFKLFAPSFCAGLSGKVQAWRRAYVANNPTKTLPDLASTLPLLHEACMSMSGWNASKKQQSWTMILLRLIHGLRASSLSQYVK
jgi:hypothetical protein